LDTPVNVELLLARDVSTSGPEDDGIVAFGVQLAETSSGVELVDVEALAARSPAMDALELARLSRPHRRELGTTHGVVCGQDPPKAGEDEVHAVAQLECLARPWPTCRQELLPFALDLHVLVLNTSRIHERT
jgi:hypothetical protein